MKKSILSLAIVLALFSSAFAAPAAVNERAVAAFKIDFYKASDVQWTVSENFVKAKFVMDKDIMFAYYDFDGNLIGLVHHMLTNGLPQDLQKDIKKYYGNYWVSELFKVTNDQGDHYFIQLKNADETIVLTSDGKANWHRYSMPKTSCETL